MKITKNERLQLLGLLTLGRKYYTKIDAIYDAITETVGEDNTFVHDAMYEIESELDIDSLLEKAGIEVTGETVQE